LASRIAEEAHWNRMLSLGEQQRLGVARAILLAPDYLFLDEATASLDEAGRGGALSSARAGGLPHTAIVSIGHRATLTAYHRRRLSFIARATRPGCVKETWRRRRKIHPHQRVGH